MANLPISGLTASATNLAAADVLPVVQTTGVGPVKMTGQQLAGGLLGSTTLSGAPAIATSQPLLDLSQTWNNAAVTFTGAKLNITATASNAASLLMDLGTGGGSFVSQFSVRRDGVVNATGSMTAAGVTASSSGLAVLQLSTTASYGFHLARDYVVSWGNNATLNGSLDLILSRRGAANLRLGAADVGSTTSTVTITIATPGVVTWSSHGLSTGTPVFFTTTGALPTGITASTTYYVIFVTDSTFQIATSVANALAGTAVNTSGTQSGTQTGNRNAITQALSVQSVTGVTNRLGADMLITGSQGTGTGAGGSLIFQVAPAGSSGSAQNALATALTIDSTRLATFSLGASFPGGSSGSLPIQISASNYGLYRGTTQGGQAVIVTCGGTDIFAVGQNSGIGVVNIGPYSWASTIGSTADVLLFRDDANKLALRNGTTAQTFRIYGTTDGTNSEYLQCFYDTVNSRFEINMTKTGGSSSNRSVVYRGPTGAGSMSCNTGTNIWSVGQDGVGVFWNLTSSGHLLTQNDNTYDIGAVSATRPRTIYAGTDIYLGQYIRQAANLLYIVNGAGILQLSNASNTDFGRLQFGGTTSSFPALKRSTTFLQARLADDSAFAGFASANMQAATAYTVATLPGTPGTGMIARVTDALAPTIGTTVASGGAAYALVNYNGANWTVIGV